MKKTLTRFRTWGVNGKVLILWLKIYINWQRQYHLLSNEIIISRKHGFGSIGKFPWSKFLLFKEIVIQIEDQVTTILFSYVCFCCCTSNLARPWFRFNCHEKLHLREYWRIYAAFQSQVEEIEFQFYKSLLPILLVTFWKISALSAAFKMISILDVFEKEVS